MEDYQIITLYNARDSTAIHETNVKYGKLCYKVADGILHCKEDNEECVNDTYLTAWNNIPPDKPVYLSAYICRITRNLSLKKYEYIHAKKRNPAFNSSLSELAEIQSNIDAFEKVENKDLGREISCFLRTLPATERNIFIRKYVLFHTVKYIAADFSFSQSKIKSMLAVTRRKLKEHLNNYFGDHYE